MKYKLVLVLALLICISICLPAFADTVAITPVGGSEVGTTSNSQLSSQIVNIYKKSAYVIGSLASLCMLGVGFMFIKSRGDERKLAEAKAWLTAIVWGIAIAGGALVIVGFIIWLMTSS